MKKKSNAIYFKKIACKGKYHDDNAIANLIEYITLPRKTPSQLIYGVNVDMDDIAASMVAVSEKYKKNNRLRLHHFIVSFRSGYFDELDLLEEIQKAICNRIGKEYQIASAVHEDTDHPHIHFIFNAVSFINGYKYRAGKEEYWELIDRVETILSEYDLHPLIPVKYHPDKSDQHEW